MDGLKLEDMSDEDIHIALRMARSVVNDWVERERNLHGQIKFHSRRAEDTAKLQADPHLAEEEYWYGFLAQYLGRARVLGLDTELGRQAFGKFIVTAHACLDSAVVAFGAMPEPGHPSGEIV